MAVARRKAKQSIDYLITCNNRLLKQNTANSIPCSRGGLNLLFFANIPCVDQLHSEFIGSNKNGKTADRLPIRYA